MTRRLTTRVALISGITGQDGSYLAEWLLKQGYQVHGLIRSPDNLGHVANLRSLLHLHYMPEFSFNAFDAILKLVKPDEFYNLAATSFVPQSLVAPIECCKLTATMVLETLEAIRRLDKPVRMFQAGSSEMYGMVAQSPQDERTPFHPQTPYASAKVFAHNIVHNYREHFGVFACNGILFNHESPRRSPEFVTRKITRAAARIRLGLQEKLVLGNMQAQRDWGFAGDFVRAMWLMLQQDRPDDYVIGTGCTASVRDFVQIAFEHVDLDYRDHVFVDPSLYRPVDPYIRKADCSKARHHLGWYPTTTLRELIALMIEHDLQQARQENHPLNPVHRSQAA